MGLGLVAHARSARERFPDFSHKLFEGLHSLNTSHRAEPKRTAELLGTFWAQAEPS